MEQQKEFLAHQSQALKKVAKGMGVQKNKISYLEERSRASSEARWRLFANEDERSMEEISDNRTERVTFATGAKMLVPPMYRGS